MRRSLLRRLPLALVGLLLLGSLAHAADAALSEADYDRAVADWHRQWTAREAKLFDRKSCVAYWQGGDAVRQRMRAVTPPPSRAAYHEALLAFVDAALETADECIGSPRYTPRRAQLLQAATQRHRALGQAASKIRPRPPANWL